MKKLFLYVFFFLATQLSALLLPIHSVRKTRVPYLIRLQKHSRRLQSLHAFQKKTKPYYTYYNKLTTIENHWKVAKRFLWKLPEIILELKITLCKLQICPLKCPRLKNQSKFLPIPKAFFSLVCKVHNCHVGDHQILSFFLMSARVFSIYWALLQCIQFSSLKPSLKNTICNSWTFTVKWL